MFLLIVVSYNQNFSQIKKIFQKIFTDRGIKLKTQWLIDILPRILYLCVIVIGGHLHAENHDLK